MGMKAESAKTLKINSLLHKALKGYCVEVETPLQDFVNSVLNTALPPDHRVDFIKKKKKVK
jgi:hypothetical protein